jgi:hypothetical protein
MAARPLSVFSVSPLRGRHSPERVDHGPAEFLEIGQKKNQPFLAGNSRDLKPPVGAGH